MKKREPEPERPFVPNSADRLAALSRHEFFAGCALTGILTLWGNTPRSLPGLIDEAWEVADLMVAAARPPAGDT